ncbi:hypothetical protein FPV67DRAFT_220056 [Lyophyllum atratum]|nr:hypothetical protein FPV67DRAFT_220056 [Lyophyllum atratum]
MKFTHPIVLAASFVLASTSIALPVSEKFEIDMRSVELPAGVLARAGLIMERAPSVFKAATSFVPFSKRSEIELDLDARSIVDYDELHYTRSFEDDELFAREYDVDAQVVERSIFGKIFKGVKSIFGFRRDESSSLDARSSEEIAERSIFGKIFKGVKSIFGFRRDESCSSASMGRSCLSARWRRSFMSVISRSSTERPRISLRRLP